MADVGTGLTIVFGTSGFSAEITGVNGNAISRESFKTSHMGTTGGHTKRFGDLVDPGVIDLEFQFDPDEQPPITADPEQITITFPIPSGSSNGATLVGTGGIKEWSWGAELEGLMTASAQIEWTGGLPVWTDAS